MREVIETKAAPRAIGTYSQAIKSGTVVYVSGQIPLDPDTMQVVAGDFREKTRRVFLNLQAVIEAAGGELANIVKLNIYLLDLDNFDVVNEVMSEFCAAPYPARACVEVSRLPKDVEIEMDAVVSLGR